MEEFFLLNLIRKKPMLFPLIIPELCDRLNYYSSTSQLSYHSTSLKNVVLGSITVGCGFCLALASGWVAYSSLSLDFVLSLAACFGQWMLADVTQVGLEMTLHGWAYPLVLLPSLWPLLNFPFSLGPRVKMGGEARISLRNQVHLDSWLQEELPH
jgi:hypothetical protein